MKFPVVDTVGIQGQTEKKKNIYRVTAGWLPVAWLLWCVTTYLNNIERRTVSLIQPSFLLERLYGQDESQQKHVIRDV